MNSEYKDLHYLIAMAIAGIALLSVVVLYVAMSAGVVSGGLEKIEGWMDAIVTMSLAFLIGIWIGKQRQNGSSNVNKAV